LGGSARVDNGSDRETSESAIDKAGTLKIKEV